MELLQRELRCSEAMAQVLVRRGLGAPDEARAWLAAADAAPPAAFAGIDRAVALVRAHLDAGTRITVHGDYDVDGICSTAVLVRTLRRLGGDVDWYLPARLSDGYGLAAATVDRLHARGTRLLITVDCAITAVEEVAWAQELGMDVLVTDHHTPRADGRLPDAPIVHPAVCGYPTPELCAAGVAHKLAEALTDACGAEPAHVEALRDDLDLVALATVADCVPLVAENRRLVRAGLLALAATRKPGLRALMEVARVDPSALDARAISFRLAPRLNAAGRVERADASLELVLTEDPERAAAVAAELDRLNGDRRAIEQRISWEAEALVRAEQAAREAAGLPAPMSYVLAGDGWHPGVIGIVASRIAERHGRPCVLLAFPEVREGATPDPAQAGTGSGRSIPAFDLLSGLEAGAAHLLRHGGHRAAAGCTIARASVEAFRIAFEAHAAAALRPEDLLGSERVDAVVGGEALGLELAEELQGLEPFGTGNPAVSLLVPGARLVDGRPMGEEGRHVRFSVESGGAKARGVAFGLSRLPDDAHLGLDATFALEVNEWQGAVEPRLVLRATASLAPGPLELAGEPGSWDDAVRAELTATGPDAWPQQDPWPPLPVLCATDRRVVDRRGHGALATVRALVASGESVLVVAADAHLRARGMRGRIGDVTLTSWAALEGDAAPVRRAVHVVALDPPAHAAQLDALVAPMREVQRLHLAWGPAEQAFAQVAHAAHLPDRDAVVAAYRALRAAAGASAAGAEARTCLGASPRTAGAELAVLAELGLVTVDPGSLRVSVPPPTRRLDLEASPRYAAAAARRVQLEVPVADPPLEAPAPVAEREPALAAGAA